MTTRPEAKDFKSKLHNMTYAQPDQMTQSKLANLAEAKFLKVGLRDTLRIMKKSKPISELTSLEAMIDLEYLTLIILHHRRSYYRLSNPQLPDSDYDLLEDRAMAIMEAFPQLVEPNHPLSRAGY